MIFKKSATFGRVHCTVCKFDKKASANKIKILVFFIWTPQYFMYFGWTFAVEFFSGVYRSQNTRILILFADAFKRININNVVPWHRQDAPIKTSKRWKCYEQRHNPGHNTKHLVRKSLKNLIRYFLKVKNYWWYLEFWKKKIENATNNGIIQDMIPHIWFNEIFLKVNIPGKHFWWKFETGPIFSPKMPAGF